jgi:hypothetical protein
LYRMEISNSFVNYATRYISYEIENPTTSSFSFWESRIPYFDEGESVNWRCTAKRNDEIQKS